MSSDHTKAETHAELEALFSNPAAAAEWEELRRIEDALDAPCAPEALHGKIMGRIAADGPAPWMEQGAATGAQTSRTRMPAWALAAAILLVVAVVGFELRRPENDRTLQPGALANVTAAVPMQLEFTARIVEAAMPARLEAEGRGMTRFAASFVQTAASPLRAMPAQIDRQPRGDASVIERERPS